MRPFLGLRLLPLLLLLPLLFPVRAAQAQGIPPWARPPKPPLDQRHPPLQKPPLNQDSCSPNPGLTNLVGDLGTAVATQPAVSLPVNPTKIEDFANSSDPANVRAMLDFVAAKYGLPKDLLYATAWTESRWAQWEADGTATQGGNDYGLMQINKPTWDGTYDWTRIKTDVRYNIQAGAEILKWGYNYASGKGKTGDALLQSAYAIYNGGPDALSRPSNAKSPYHQHDVNFWDNYTSKPWESALNV